MDTDPSASKRMFIPASPSSLDSNGALVANLASQFSQRVRKPAIRLTERNEFLIHDLLRGQCLFRCHELLFVFLHAQRGEIEIPGVCDPNAIRPVFFYFPHFFPVQKSPAYGKRILAEMASISARTWSITSPWCCLSTATTYTTQASSTPSPLTTLSSANFLEFEGFRQSYGLSRAYPMATTTIGPRPPVCSNEVGRQEERSWGVLPT